MMLGCLLLVLPVSAMSTLTASGSDNNIIVGHLNASLVALGDHVLRAHNGSLEAMFRRYDDRAVGYLAAEQLEAILQTCHVGTTHNRAGIAANLVTALDWMPPYDLEVTLIELEGAFSATGWYNRSTVNMTTCPAQQAYCPSYSQPATASCPSCPRTDVNWPKLSPPTIISTTASNATATVTCDFDEFIDCMNGGIFGCSDCDVKSGCTVHMAAVAYTATQVYGEPLLIQRDFIPLMDIVHQAAREAGVFLAVLRPSLNADDLSARCHGRSLRVRLSYSGGSCDAQGCADTDSVARFKELLEATGDLQLFGNDTIAEVPPQSASAAFQEAAKAGCALPHVTLARPAPMLAAAMPEAAAAATRNGAEACLSNINESAAALACLGRKGACTLSTPDVQALASGAEVFCRFIRRCFPVAGSRRNDFEAACPTPLQQAQLVAEPFPSGSWTTMTFVREPPPGPSDSDEYANPWESRRDTPLVDALGTSPHASLAGGITVADALSRFNPGRPEYTVAAGAGLRNRFFRADARLLRCLDAVHALEPLAVLRLYETRAEARARGEEHSRHRSGSAAVVA